MYVKWVFVLLRNPCTPVLWAGFCSLTILFYFAYQDPLITERAEGRRTRQRVSPIYVLIV